MKSISAIIVNWNDKQVTAACIRSLEKQDCEPVEIIVCDNGSTDGSVDFLKSNFPHVRLIENKDNLGFGPALNHGLKIAKGNHLIFLNNDLVLAPDCLRLLSIALDSNPWIGGTVPKILFENKSGRINSFGVDIHYTGIACPHLFDAADSPNMKPYETACGGIFMFPRTVYEATQGFDPDLFLYHEDHDLSWRIRLLGYRIETCPQAVMRHQYKFNKGVFKYYSSEKNRLVLLLKNYRWKTLLLITPALLAVEAAQWAHAIMNGWFGLKLKSYFEVCVGLPGILKKRSQVQSTRQVNDREITGLHEDKLQLSGVKHPMIDKWLSPFLEWYGERIRKWI